MEGWSLQHALQQVMMITLLRPSHITCARNRGDEHLRLTHPSGALSSDVGPNPSPRWADLAIHNVPEVAVRAASGIRGAPVVATAVLRERSPPALLVQVTSQRGAQDERVCGDAGRGVCTLLATLPTRRRESGKKGLESQN